MKKMIVIDNCMACPFVQKCKPWKKLTAEQRFKLKLGVGIGAFILKGCPLPEVGSTEDVFEGI